MVQCVLHFDLFYDQDRTGIIRLASEMDYQQFSTAKNNPETLLINAPLLRSNVPEAVQGRIFRRYENIATSFRDHDRKFRLWHERAEMLEILSLYLEQPQAVTKNTERDEKWRNVEKALAYIHAHYAESLKLPDISRKAGISMNYFCQVFKQHTGQSVHRYLIFAI